MFYSYTGLSDTKLVFFLGDTSSAIFPQFQQEFRFPSNMEGPAESEIPTSFLTSSKFRENTLDKKPAVVVHNSNFWQGMLVGMTMLFH